MPRRNHPTRALAAAGLLVTAIGIGAVVGSPGLASAPVDPTTAVSAEDTKTLSIVDDVASATLDGATTDDITDARLHRGGWHADGHMETFNEGRRV